jgi:hypothetical protein
MRVLASLLALVAAAAGLAAAVHSTPVCSIQPGNIFVNNT